MSLLREIQEEATKSDSDVLVLLRKCRVLASRIANEELKIWVEHELNGYDRIENLPDYRRVVAISKGHFSGPFGRGLRNAEIPPSTIPEDLRHLVRDVNLREGIGSYCDLLAQGESSGSFQIAWPADAYRLVGRQIYQDFALVQAWQELTRGSIVNVVETVKNRILNVALELESEDPKAGEGFVKPDKSAARKVSQIVTTNIYGTVGNLATGSSQFSQSSEINISQGNLKELVEYLRTNGIAERDTKELEKALKTDGPAPKGAENYGAGVSGWLGKMMSKAASGAWQISTTAAGQVLAAGLKSYYGF